MKRITKIGVVVTVGTALTLAKWAKNKEKELQLKEHAVQIKEQAIKYRETVLKESAEYKDAFVEAFNEKLESVTLDDGDASENLFENVRGLAGTIQEIMEDLEKDADKAEEVVTSNLKVSPISGLPESDEGMLQYINELTLDELLTYKGVGETTANRILEGKPYTSLNQLKEIKIRNSNAYKLFCPRSNVSCILNPDDLIKFLNQSDSEQIQKIDGVGKTLATMLEQSAAENPFTDLSDLKNITFRSGSQTAYDVLSKLYYGTDDSEEYL